MDFEYKLERIGKNIKICVTKEHTFGTDAILLFDFAAPGKKDKVCDIGTGCGIIGVLAAAKGAETVGVEIQEKAAEQAEISGEESGVSGLFSVMNVDLKELSAPIKPFSLVICNPPYFKPESGKLSGNPAFDIARQEIKCRFSDIASAAARILCDKGRFCVCHKPERLPDVLCEMRKNRIEPKRLQFVKKCSDGVPWLVLIEGRKGGGEGLLVLPDAVIVPGAENTDTYNRYREEMKNER